MALNVAKIFTRRNFVRVVVGGVVGAAVGGGYSRWAEPQWLEVEQVKVRLGDGTPGPVIRVLHLSDFHASPAVSLKFIAKAIALGLAQRPDVVVLTGDFFTDHLTDGALYAEILARLSAVAPTFACLGNHDGGSWSRRAGGAATVDGALELLRSARIPCLVNRSETIVVRGQPIQFIGVGDLWASMCLPAVAFAQTPPRDSAWRIVLNHNPDAKVLLRPFDWDVVLCGHTHGGQIRLPFFGTPFAPVSDKRYVAGLHRWENRWLYVTRGVGNLHGVRFNCRPQVSIVELS
ncbi:MAG: phosphodiesterase YaeI [Opitutaceae bacterium]